MDFAFFVLYAQIKAFYTKNNNLYQKTLNALTRARMAAKNKGYANII